MGSNILLRAGYTDNKIIGYKGSISKYNKAGETVKILIFISGLTSRIDKRSRENLVEKLSSQHNFAKDLARFFGEKKIELIDFFSKILNTIGSIEIVKVIKKRIDLFKSEIIYTHNNGNLNIDNQIINKAVFNTFRQFMQNLIIKKLTFEFPYSFETKKNSQSNLFTPNLFINIHLDLSIKSESLKEYKDEIKKWPHPSTCKNVQITVFYKRAQVFIKKSEILSLI